MRTVFTPVMLAAGLFLSAAPAIADTHICIDTRNIVSSEPDRSGSSILFKMRDGTQWRNTLQGRCPDLDFGGYAWTVRNPDNTVCEKEQTLRVLQSGEICSLGKFEKVVPPPKAAG